jgi:hypothetical protein
VLAFRDAFALAAEMGVGSLDSKSSNHVSDGIDESAATAMLHGTALSAESQDSRCIRVVIEGCVNAEDRVDMGMRKLRATWSLQLGGKRLQKEHMNEQLMCHEVFKKIHLVHRN